EVKAADGTILLSKPKGIADGAWSLAARKTDGIMDLWTLGLPSEPARWGLCLDRDGRILVTLRDGRVVGYGDGAQ
ncbi:MAG: hypothetical protein NT049_18035, partial [Planctomycetota bacterium]|nr:hypothetical protein [Planctomycetota bacterium]